MSRPMTELQRKIDRVEAERSFALEAYNQIARIHGRLMPDERAAKRDLYLRYLALDRELSKLTREVPE